MAGLPDAAAGLAGVHEPLEGGLTVVVDGGGDELLASDLAARLGVSLMPASALNDCRDLDATVLRVAATGLSLEAGPMVLRGDFTRMLPRLRPNNLYGELLVKAAKIKGSRGIQRAVDATAGLGEDALLLAAAGFEVTLFERNPVMAALTRDALRRAAEVPALAQTVARMELREEDSAVALPHLPFEPDVVLLDPMFPAREKSASVKKKAQFLQRFERPCDDEAALLEAALAARPRKVVVKRPLKGPNLAGIKPAYVLAGKAVRYDVLVPPRA